MKALATLVLPTHINDNDAFRPGAGSKVEKRRDQDKDSGSVMSARGFKQGTGGGGLLVLTSDDCRIRQVPFAKPREKVPLWAVVYDAIRSRGKAPFAK
jgi:hypothetical protein